MASICFNNELPSWESEIRIKGTFYSRLSNINNSSRQFIASFFHENDSSNNQYVSRMTVIQKELLRLLREELKHFNPLIHYIQMHKEMHGDLQEVPLYSIQFSDAVPANHHPGMYNRPTASNDVAVLFHDGDRNGHHRIQFKYTHSDTLETIKSDNAYYDTLGYGFFHATD